VRDKQYARSVEQQREIEDRRRLATVQIIPSIVGDAATLLLQMREWMAERSDVVVAIGMTTTVRLLEL
jgi:hypothetical protein